MHIYWFKDSITGHLKQVDALLNQLRKEVVFSLTSIDCSKTKPHLKGSKSIFAKLTGSEKSSSQLESEKYHSSA